MSYLSLEQNYENLILLHLSNNVAVTVICKGLLENDMWAMTYKQS